MINEQEQAFTGCEDAVGFERSSSVSTCSKELVGTSAATFLWAKISILATLGQKNLQMRGPKISKFFTY